jgi:RNA polymerase subunit RPABC4/transcription elongation factor Spt4
MKCKNCNTGIDERAKFCPECGAKVNNELACSACNTKLTANVKFCPQCGTKVLENSQASTQYGNIISPNYGDNVMLSGANSGIASSFTSPVADSSDGDDWGDIVFDVASEVGGKIVEGIGSFIGSLFDD